MTVSLDQIVTVGPLRIAVLSDCRVSTNHTKEVLLFAGQKKPVAVLIKHNTTLTAFGVDGTPMTRDQIEALCQGAWRAVSQAH
ncbi:hypothetical protein [Pseudophaeobacter sp.]|uniref:hypothetical protein n=1 Tax=Pseudophaeobacter sp. TaxID=1971739 RepID=UPI0032985F50